ncbi:DUF6286 domain-containing protein [Arthrobacter sp. NicSoilB8]|uniref:DUF6286 domain-containing protein n=1 Tax=Arthrobacter sp. NicSoilB8 TaxID=2830998 RepID=UPI001CC3D7D7|nr:DUF6286 domain-containing protein [Arthrobacter sp. NicSoilB8]BCW73091.1 hypothetical protein NicSoilB8_41350 [Arthrobacter sp. NicSoilB8]
MSQDRAIRRLVRRETHSSRAGASVLTSGVLAAVFLWLALESALALLQENPLLASPDRLGRWLAGVPANTLPAGLTAAGAGLAVLGLVLLAAAITPGRRARHAVHSARSAVVVDGEVIASAVSRRARLAAGLAPGQVTTTVGKRAVRVLVRPTSGVSVDRNAVAAAVRDELAAYALDRPIAPTIHIVREGALGQ